MILDEKYELTKKIVLDFNNYFFFRCFHLMQILYAI